MNSSSSSFLSRLSLRRDPGPVLPLHMGSHQRSPPPEPRRYDDYDLANLSPRAEDSLLFSADSDPSLVASGVPAARPDRSPSSSCNRLKERQRPQRVLFAGPPPPIATSTLLHRGVEDRDGSSVASRRGHRRGHGGASVLSSASMSMTGRRPKPTISSRDSSSFDRQQSAAWTILQQRERKLQREIQALLDIQSAGLAAGLGRATSPEERSPSTSTRSQNGGGGTRSLLRSDGSSRSSTPTRPVAASAAESIYATPAGAVVPVRQPRPRKLGLRGARAGLACSISLLADLKAEESVLLEEELAARQQALAHLGALTGRRNALVKELQALDMDAAEADAQAAESAAGVRTGTDDGNEASTVRDPLVRELATLQRAHAGTAQQIAKLESQLVMLRERQRTLEARISDAQSRREAGLSGYRGALKDVDAQLAAVLRRPPLQPLDEAIVEEDDDNEADGTGDDTGSTAGVEFLRMRPERRTADMARFWWEAEVQMLERRLRGVERERAALEEGGAVWQAAVQLVTDFEAGLRQEMMAEDEEGGSNDAGAAGTSEDKMRRQLAKMADVIAGLGGHLRTAETRGWNLLLCAIGAELEAFEEAQSMLQEALRQAAEGDVDGANHDDNDGNGAAASVTPRLAQSTSDAMTSFRTAASTVSVRRAIDDDAGHEEEAGMQSESDHNDVPPELLVAHEDDDVPPDLLVARTQHDEEDKAGRDPDRGHDDAGSENEVPLDFFSEQEEHDGEA